MSIVPSNFVSRVELQKLILRCNSLLFSISNQDLAFGLKQIINGCSYLEGVLSEIVISKHPNDKILHNPYNWLVEWKCLASHTLHVNEINLTFSLEYQVLSHKDTNIPTGRYRLILDKNTYISNSKHDLKDYTLAYLNKYSHLLQEHDLDLLINRVFHE